MKGIVCACLLASLPSISWAYEADIHYSTTYVLARAVGWSEADALTIASANQGVDESQDTVAALEVDSSPHFSDAGHVASSLHQAEKNLRLHCFSTTPGDTGQIAADVLKVISDHFAEVPDDDSPQNHGRRLIALGAALHCQQDAYAHVGFGGSCGAYAGSCYGHTQQTFLDQLVFSVLKRHYYDPDHPGVSGQRLLEALQGTVSELAKRAPKADLHLISTGELVALSDALRRSGLELPDEARRGCNRYIAGKWLFELFHSGRRKPAGPEPLEKLAPDVSRSCRNPSLAAATIVRIPEPRFPRLNPDATPWLVRADGTYQSTWNQAEARAALRSNYKTHLVRVQFSHWSQLLAFPPLKQVALLSTASGRTAK